MKNYEDFPPSMGFCTTEEEKLICFEEKSCFNEENTLKVVLYKRNYINKRTYCYFVCMQADYGKEFGTYTCNVGFLQHSVKDIFSMFSLMGKAHPLMSLAFTAFNMEEIKVKEKFTFRIYGKFNHRSSKLFEKDNLVLYPYMTLMEDITLELERGGLFLGQSKFNYYYSNEIKGRLSKGKYYHHIAEADDTVILSKPYSEKISSLPYFLDTYSLNMLMCMSFR